MHRRLPRLLSAALVACVPVLGLVAAVGPAAGASTAGAHPAQHARAAAAARAALTRLMVGQHGTDHRVPGHHPRIKGLSQVQSGNWSGYADTGATFSTATGHWTEPSVSCGSRTSLAAFWVGIDGYSSSSVEQDGTLAECYQGSAYYYTWWEMYPSNAIQVVGSTLRPGDGVTASVVRSGGSYTLKVTDSSRSGDSFSTTQSCSGCANSSAEWIAEAPCCSGSNVYPLPDFHTWTLSGATVSTTSGSGVISTYPNYEITMTGTSGDVKAAPGPLNSSGNGFTVTWEHST